MCTWASITRSEDRFTNTKARPVGAQLAIELENMLDELLLYIDLSGVVLVANKLLALERAIALGNPHLALDLDLPDMLLDMGMIPDQQPFQL